MPTNGKLEVPLSIVHYVQNHPVFLPLPNRGLLLVLTASLSPRLLRIRNKFALRCIVRPRRSFQTLVVYFRR